MSVSLLKINTNLRFLYSNATSLANKWDEFIALINSLSMPHVILITETWFNNKSLVVLEGYNHFIKNRQAISHGGVAIYVRKDIIAMEELNISDDGEMIWCNLTLNKESLIVGCIYRPPHSHYESNQEIIKSKAKASAIANRRKDVGLLIAGDFNHPDVQWSDSGGLFGSKKGRSSSIEMVNCLIQNELSQLVRHPTFGHNTLDLVISDNPGRIYQIFHGPPIASSKKNKLHCTLTWDYSLKGGDPRWSGLARRNFHKGNYDKFSNIMFTLVLTAPNRDDPNLKFSALLDKYNEALEACVPTINPSSVKKLRPKWFDQEIKMAVSNKYRLFCKIRAGASDAETAISYRKSCKELKVKVRSARLSYEASLVSKCKSEPKLLYGYINNQKACKDVISMLRGPDGIITTSTADIVNILNEQFCLVFNPPTDKISTSTSLSININAHNQAPFEVDPNEIFSVGNVSKELSKLNSRKSVGPDGIHPLVLKSCSETLSLQLSNIFICSFTTGIVPDKWKEANITICSFTTGIVPDKWKEANITPIFKKGDKIEPSNYRPISLTSIPCKLMERMVRDIMLNHLHKYDSITKEQHGFVKNKSCLTNLLETMDTVTHAFNDGLQTLVVFLDFQKAFDKVCHESLHFKLERLGFSCEIRTWLRNYLSNRKQRVVIGDKHSDWRPVTSGVPQGSVLGPLLFVIFINDMPAVVNHIVKLFADDSKLIGVIRNEKDLEQVQYDLDALVNWAKEWRMMFHPDKCKVMNISRIKPARPQLTMEKTDSTGRHILEYTDVERDLGVIMSSNLKSEHQVASAVSKANMVISTLRRTFKYWTPYIFRILYTAFIRPHLEYAAPAWSPYLKKDILALENVQRRATKLVKELKNLKYE